MKERSEILKTIYKGANHHIVSSIVLFQVGAIGNGIGMANFVDGNITKGVAGLAGGTALLTIEAARSYRDGRRRR